jgi:tetratricopeptide (TPR) repeat protein
LPSSCGRGSSKIEGRENAEPDFILGRHFMNAQQQSSQSAALVASGDLRTTPFAELLVALLDARANGTLRIDDEGGEPHALIRFEAGVPCAARVARPEAGLLHSLVPLCARGEGRYAFAQGEDGVGDGPDVVNGAIDPLALIAASMRGPVREDAVHRALAMLGSSPLKLNPRVDLARYQFTGQENAVISMLWQAPVDVLQLQGQADVAPHLLRRLLYVLAITRGVTALPPPHRATSGTIVHAPPLPAPETQTEPRARREQPTEVIALDPPSPQRASSPVRKPFTATVLEHSPPPAKPVADGARARRSRLLQGENKPEGRYHVRHPAEGRTELPAAAVELGLPRDLPPALQLWCGEILERARMIARSNYYEVLGLERDCLGEQIERALEAIVKHFNPQQLPEELATVRDRAQAIVECATQAADTLRDTERRRRYDRDLDAGTSLGVRPSVQRGLEAEAHYRKAEGLLKRKDYAGALHESERALTIGGACARYEALYGYLLFLRGGAAGNIDPRALEYLTRALKRDSRCAEAHYYMATVLKQSGQSDKAREHYERVLKAHPGHLDAARELRLYEARSPKRRPNSGFLERLLGRKSAAPPARDKRPQKRRPSQPQLDDDES